MRRGCFDLVEIRYMLMVKKERDIDIDYLAGLSRLMVGDDERTFMESKIVEILNWVEVLSEVDTEGVVAKTSSSFEGLPRRADEVTEGGDVERVLSNAPDRLMDFYVVPKVVE